MIPLYDRSVRGNLGHALETAVILEVLRRGVDLVYLRREQSREVDALAMMPDGQQWLVQVCSSLEDPAVRMRAITSLKELAVTPAVQAAQPLLISARLLSGHMRPMPAGLPFMAFSIPYKMDGEVRYPLRLDDNIYSIHVTVFAILAPTLVRP